MKCPKCGYEHEQANSNQGTPLGVGKTLEPQPSLFDGEVAKQSGDDAGKNRPFVAGKRRTQLSPTWQPTDEQRKYCRQQGKDPDAMAEAFKGYYLAKGTVWKDWNLVWMKACREWEGRKVPEAGKPYWQPPDLDQWRKRLSARFWSPWWGSKPGEPGCQVPRELWELYQK